MKNRRFFGGFALAAALTLSAAACSSGAGGSGAASPAASSASTGAATPSAASSAGGAGTAASTGTASDIAFAQSMIPHHEQAVEMADLALDPKSGASSQVREMATAIKAAQGPEIERMTGWLEQWQAPTAMPGSGSGDMANMDHGGHDMGGVTMSGMMTEQDMAALHNAKGGDFDTMWLQMMIAHHEGAVLMAQQVASQPGNPEVAALAGQIAADQKSEIDMMKKQLEQ